MGRGHWWWDTPAAVRGSQLQSLECWTLTHIFVHSTSQHSATWQSDPLAFYQSTQHHMAVRSLCIAPVNTVPHGGQILLHSTSQHSTTWRSDWKLVRREAGHKAQRATLCCQQWDFGCFDPLWPNYSQDQCPSTVEATWSRRSLIPSHTSGLFCPQRLSVYLLENQMHCVWNLILRSTISPWWSESTVYTCVCSGLCSDQCTCTGGQKQDVHIYEEERKKLGGGGG